MISAPQRPVLKRQQKAVLKQIGSLREQMEDLHDYLDLLEARARNKGKPTLPPTKFANNSALPDFLTQRRGDAMKVAGDSPSHWNLAPRTLISAFSFLLSDFASGNLSEGPGSQHIFTHILMQQPSAVKIVPGCRRIGFGELRLAAKVGEDRGGIPTQQIGCFFDGIGVTGIALHREAHRAILSEMRREQHGCSP